MSNVIVKGYCLRIQTGSGNAVRHNCSVRTTYVIGEDNTV